MEEIPLSLLISAGGEGAEVVYGLRNDSTLANLVLDNIGDAGQVKRKVYQRRLPENPNKDYYYIIRETAPNESILIEYGFIDNPRDLRRLQNDLDKYAEGVVKAIAEYTNTPYTLPGQSSDGSSGEIPIGNYYTVQRGDSLWSIAQKFGITVNELKSLNNLTSNNINVGQRLLISRDINNDINGVSNYIVQKGDSLWSIAQKFGMTVNELKSLNNLTSNVLSVGQQLLVNNNGIIPNPDMGESNNTDNYIVKKGDSLWSIARNFGITPQELINYNNLTNLTIYIGQELKIPYGVSDMNNYTEYTVVSGDTLWNIAKRYNTTVDDIVKDNNLISPILSIGQKLNIRK